MSNKILIAFVPVLHQGYMNFFRKHAGSVLYLLNESLYREFEHLTREVRALSPNEMSLAIDAFRIFENVFVAHEALLEILDSNPNLVVVMPDEDICRHIANKYLPNTQVEFESVFLRYDMPQSMNQIPVIPDMQISIKEFDVAVMEVARVEATHSPDWWRQVGAAIVKDGKVIAVAHNRHMPYEHTLYAFGDPRGNFRPGEYIEITGAHHAEKVLISHAAGEGIALKGLSMYVTTFPCNPCAFDIAGAQIAELYFVGGYSSVLGQETLRSRGVKIIQVKI